MRETFTAWISRYALSQGVFSISAHDCFDISPGMIGDNSNSQVSYHGLDWHRDRQSAVDRAEKMRIKKISSLKKQIAKLEKLTFTPPNHE